MTGLRTRDPVFYFGDIMYIKECGRGCVDGGFGVSLRPYDAFGF